MSKILKICFCIFLVYLLLCSENIGDNFIIFSNSLNDKFLDLKYYTWYGNKFWLLKILYIKKAVTILKLFVSISNFFEIILIAFKL